VTRPTMRFVEVKSPEQQSVMVLRKVRMMLMRQRIRLSNAIRGHIGEFGLVGPIGREGLAALLMIVEGADERLPEEARICLELIAAQLDLVNRQILETDRRMRTHARATDPGRRLMTIPRVGPVLASALVATVADPKGFRTGRNLAAWIGLVPKQNSSGGKERCRGLGGRQIRAAPWNAPALACEASGQASHQSRHCRTGQQNRADVMGCHDDRRRLSRARTAGRVKTGASAPQ